MGTRISLSIIIPVYKVEPYLRECLDSIAVSQLDCWEAILIDDGSPDGCPLICDEYAARDIRFRVIHQENAGVAVARNAGLDVAQGEWCWFVDSDDIVDMRPVGEVMVWLEEHQNVDLVMFDLKMFRDKENHNENENSKLTIDGEYTDNNGLYMHHIIFHHQRLWYRKDILSCHVIRFTEGVRLAEDLELMYKYMTLCQSPVKLNSLLYYYREREGSATQNDTYRMKAVEDLQIVLSNLADWVRELGTKPEPWLDFRIMKLFQNLLYSASQVERMKKGNANGNGNDAGNIQFIIRSLINDYRQLRFPFTNMMKYRLANWNVGVYFLLNKIYLAMLHKNK